MEQLAAPVLAPDFALTDTEGRRVRLADYRDRRNLILVFNRGLL